MAENDVLLMVAPNGARRTKADHPALPMTPQELAADAAACLEAGAAALHLHARDAEGAHSLRPDDLSAAIDAVRARVGEDMVIQMTTEQAGRYDTDQQIAAVQAVKPETVSVALREIVPDGTEESLQRAADFFQWLREERITPQFILYAPQEVARFVWLKGLGVIPYDHPFMLFVLGRDPQREGDPAELLEVFVTALNVIEAEWMACTFADAPAVIFKAAVLGGHVRVGFENTLTLADGTAAANNAQLVAEAADILRQAGRGLMDAGAARALLASCG